MEILVEAKRLEKIPYSDKPLPQGGTIEYLSSEEFEKKLGFTYTESLQGDRKELSKYLKDKELLSQIRNRMDLPKDEAVLERLANPLDCLVVCKMDDQVGHGLFASKDIPAGTVLFMYSGTIEAAKTYEKGDEYTYCWGSLNSNAIEKIVSAKQAGGLSRFMQHLPQDQERHKKHLKQELLKQFNPVLIAERGINLDEFVEELMQQAKDHELEDVKFHDLKMKEQLATGNVHVCQTVINGVPVIACVAEYDIKAGEQIGFSYGESYWKTAEKKPCYFLKDGNLIPKTAYAYRKELEKQSVKKLIEKFANQ